MNDEEAEGLLRTLRATLAEFGSPAVIPPRHLAPEEGEPDFRNELNRMLEEYEAVLVDAPKMMKATMDMLGARSLRFVADQDDMRFSVRSGDAGPQNRPEITLTSDTVETWVAIANEASGVIAQLREHINDQPR